MNTLAAELTDTETAALMYLAQVSLWHDAPETASIGAAGLKSRAMTKDMVLHLYLTGHLRPRRRGILCKLRESLCRMWRRWEIACAPEPNDSE